MNSSSLNFYFACDANDTTSKQLAISITLHAQLHIGWVDIGTSTGVQSGFVYLYEKIRKTAKNVSVSSYVLTKGQDFPGQAL
jgi:hypothetical protein